MDSLTQWRDQLKTSLHYYADLPYPFAPQVQTYVGISQDLNPFFLRHEGWQGHQRIHGIVVHAESRDHKIWIHYDGMEDSITADLEAAGVPKERIVLAFQPPDLRNHTGYAIA